MNTHDLSTNFKTFWSKEANTLCDKINDEYESLLKRHPDLSIEDVGLVSGQVSELTSLVNKTLKAPLPFSFKIETAFFAGKFIASLVSVVDNKQFSNRLDFT
jgi:hypothetical protein